MLILLGLAVSAFLVGLSGALAPGPVLVVAINHSIRQGFRAGPLIVLGHGILEVSIVALVALGFDRYVKDAMVIGIVGLIGGLVLLWMGTGMLRNVRTLSMSFRGNGETGVGPVASGFLSSASNPYFIVWWATIGVTFITQALQYGLLGLLVFYIGHILSDLVWYSFVSGAISKGKERISDRIYRGLVLVCGVFLVGFGLYFGISGVRFL